MSFIDVLQIVQSFIINLQQVIFCTLLFCNLIVVSPGAEVVRVFQSVCDAWRASAFVPLSQERGREGERGAFGRSRYFNGRGSFKVEGDFIVLCGEHP
jgi:hypothetical protein